MRLRLPGRMAVIAALVAAVSSGAGLPPAAAAPPPTGEIRGSEHPLAVPGNYVVVLHDDVAVAALDVAARYATAAPHFVYGVALNGFAIRTTARQAARMAADPRVAYVEQDRAVTMNVFVQPSPPNWALDRIDQRSLPLDRKYHYPGTGSRSTAYIIDTGIRFSHQEFGGRAVRGVDTVGDGQNGNDCHGHGTHVAGIAGGKSVGVAKGVRLVSVRVLNCFGSGTFAGVIAGVDWVTRDQLANPGRRSVANMSLGASGTHTALTTAINNSIDANVHYSVAAGGSATDACHFTPSGIRRVTTVGGTGMNDARAGFSNFGPCVDLWAPSVGVYSAWASADDAYSTLSGTSMASPQAAGTAALWRHRFPADNADTVAGALVANATPGVVTNPGAGSPNLLLFMGMIPM